MEKEIDAIRPADCVRQSSEAIREGKQRNLQQIFPTLQPVAPKNHDEPVPAVIGGRPAGQTIFFV